MMFDFIHAMTPDQGIYLITGLFLGMAIGLGVALILENIEKSCKRSARYIGTFTPITPMAKYQRKAKK